MSINQIISLPLIGFAVFVLIVEGLGYEIVFLQSRVSIVKREAIWDSVNIWIMLLSAVVYAGALSSTAGITFVDGYSLLRPGDTLSPLLGYMFGLPGCMGAGSGNLFADLISGYYGWGRKCMR